MKPIASAAALTALLALPLAAQSGNLLVNGGAETGDMTGWTDPTGHGFQAVHATTLSYVGVVEGNWAFWAGDTGPVGPWDHEVYQDVDVSAWAPDIDAGLVHWCFKAYLYSRNLDGFEEKARVVLEWYDGAGGLLATWSTPDPPLHWNAYYTNQGTDQVPVATRRIRCRMLGTRSGGANTDALLDGLHLELSGLPFVYCTAKVNSQGCTPLMASSGTPSKSDPNPFTLSAAQVINNKNGILFYGYAPFGLPFQGGTLCVQPPIRRTSVQSSGGNPPPDDCSGTLDYDFNALIQSGADPYLSWCRDVYAQYWFRDPASASSTGLTDAVGFTIRP